MSTPVTMPQLGESVSEGTVTRWLKQEGEQVQADEPLLEVSTDKVDTEIPAPTSGVLLQIKVGEDETVDVGSELAVIGEAAEAGGGGGDGAGSGGTGQPAAQAPQAEQPQQGEQSPSPQAEQPQQAQQPSESEQPQPQQAAEQPPSSSGDGAGGTPVTLPALGESVSEGTITRWLKQEGDEVQADEPLLEVSTDKVDTEIPAPTSGVLLQIKVQEDQTVDVGTELAIIGEAGAAPSPGQGQPQQESSTARAPQQGQVSTDESPAEQRGGQLDQAQQQEPPGDEPQQRQQLQERPSEELVSAPTPAPAPQPQAPSQQATQPAPDQPAPQQQAPAQGQQPQQAPQPPAQGDGQASGQGDGQADGGAYVTPLVRKLAAEHNVDLSALQGTGVGGRIRKQDVLEAARSQAQQQPEPSEQPATPAAAAATPDGQPAPSPLRGRTEKMSRLRKVIAQRMVESLQVSAQLTTVVEVDVTPIARLRERAKRDFEAREGVRLSFLPFFAKAALEALKAHPNVNALIDTEKGEITYHDAEHLGVAVDTERGLLVPVIQNAGDLNIGGLSRKIADLAERTRSNKVSPDELSGGTFTLTNTGSRGALFDTPIINQPQVAILGTGSVVKRPIVVTDPDIGEVIAIRSMVYLALTYDHRLVDGADAARFLSTVKTRLEEGKFEAELGL